MNKNEFIEALREKLAGLPQEDIEKAAEYYGEMIDDRIDNGEAENEAVVSVGSVDAAAENIIGEASLPKLIKERVRPKQPAKAWEIAMLIIGSPVWASLLIAALAVLLFGAGREAKGFGKVTAAFSCIYNTATGWFGDILSYSRIMALMLAGGVIGQVFNTVAILPAKSSGITPVTIIAFVLIFLLGHAMNFGLNLLGCYVHDLRLQCLEFFGKFYQDGGKPFTPLKLSGKFAKAK